MQEYFPPRVIASILVDGHRLEIDRKMPDKAPTRLDAVFGRVAKMIDWIEPKEDPDSIRFAERHLKELGFKSWQTGTIRSILNGVLDHHLEHNLNAHRIFAMTKIPPAPSEALQFNDRFQLGVRVGGERLSDHPRLNDAVRRDFTGMLDQARLSVPYLLHGNAPSSATRRTFYLQNVPMR